MANLFLLSNLSGHPLLKYHVLQGAERRSPSGDVMEEKQPLSSRKSSRANSLMLNSRMELRGLKVGPLEFMLSHSGPPASETGEDLHQWLTFREQGRDVEDSQEFLDSQEDSDGSMSKHQEIKEVGFCSLLMNSMFCIHFKFHFMPLIWHR